MTNNSVLLLTTYYPPSNLIESRRAYGLAKYLPEFGWTSYVITIKWTKDIDRMGIDPLLETAVEKQDNVTRVPYRPNKYYPLFQTPHLIANKLRSKHNIPWIADFRDLWDQKKIKV